MPVFIQKLAELNGGGTDDQFEDSIETYDPAKRRTKSRGIDSLLEPASDEPSCVDGMVLDPSPEGTVVGESGVSDGDSAGEAALQLLMGGV